MHPRFLLLAALFALVLPTRARGAPEAPTRVEMEVALDPSMSSNMAAQKWIKALGDAGINNVRFRSLQNGDQMGVTSQHHGEGTLVKITGQLKSNGTIATSGGQFTLADAARLKKWLDDLKSGVALPGRRKTVFGLTSQQFDDAKKILSAPVPFATKGMRPEKAIQQIQATLAASLSIDPEIDQALAADDPVRDELKGLSLGTALAALVRPAGGVLLPQATEKGIALVLAKPAAGEMWPIGWPPDETDESKVIPALFKFIPVEIDGVPAADALTALQTRLNVPFLFDYNSLVRGRVNLKKPVKLAVGKSFYRKILDSVLFQAGLKAEVRVDDAGTPLIWITTL